MINGRTDRSRSPPLKHVSRKEREKEREKETRINLAVTPLFIAAAVIGPVTMVKAMQTPLTEDNSVVEAFGNLSLKAIKRTPKTRVVEPVHTKIRMQPATAPQPHPPSKGAGGLSSFHALETLKINSGATSMFVHSRSCWLIDE